MGMAWKWILAGAMAATVHAEQLFFLHSEIWRNLGGQGGAALITSYQYDSQGNRILKGVRPLPDSTGPFQASTRYAYDTQGRLASAILLDGADTSSMVEYAYDASGNLAVFRTREKDGSLRLTDSLIYDGKGRLVETRRLAGGVLTQSHLYGYNSDDKVVSDSVFERQGNTFSAAQAILTAYGSDGAAIAESYFRESGGVWYKIHTVKLRYTGLLLSSRARYHGDAGALVDSVAYAYDADGNRIKESGFDDELDPVYSIDYSWRSFGPGAVRPGDRNRGRIAILSAPGALNLLSDARRPLVLKVRDARGASLGGATFADGSGIWIIPAGMARGRYLAEAVQDGARRAIPFTVP